MTVSASFISGKPIMVDYDPGATVVHAGDVVIVGDLPCVAHEDIPAFTGAKTLDAVAIRGGNYAMTADGTYPIGSYVYWDPTQSKVTASDTASASAVPFGWIVGGSTNRLSDAAGTAVLVHHDPTDDTGLIYCLGATANDNITNTSAETAFATTAVIPAGQLAAGDVLHVRAVGIVNAQNSTNTNAVKLKISTAANTFTAILNTGAINAAANAVFMIDADLIFTAVGASGNLYATGDSSFGTTAGGTRTGFLLANTAINTNLAVTVEVTDTQSAASTGNVTQLMELLIEKKRR